MHMMAFRYNGSIIVVDAGVMFPDDELLGVDVIVPDIGYLLENKSEVRGIFLTHGHEDHIGALPFVLPYLNVPVYGSSFTMGLVRNKLEQHGLLERTNLNTVKAKEIIELGPFKVEFFHVTHSIVDSFALAIQTPAGTVIHTGDFKIDPTPIDGKTFDLHTLAAYGDRGVLALFSDSTNAEHAGHTGSERSVNDRFESIFRTSKGRVILSCFTSSIPRIQLVLDQAKQFGRVVSFLGRRMADNTHHCRRTRLSEGSAGTDHSIQRHSEPSSRQGLRCFRRVPGRASVGSVARGARRAQGFQDRGRATRL